MVPQNYHFMEQLPTLSNGKINRRQLREDFKEETAVIRFSKATTETEEKLLDIWKQLFGYENIGIEDNYFSLGGDSLIATRLISEVQKTFGYKITISTIFENLTVKSLAKAIEQSEQKEDTLQIKPNLEEAYHPFPLTDVQYAYWLGRSGLYELGNVATHCYFELDADGLDTECAETAWNLLIQRHGMMRVIIQPDGMQRILENTPQYHIDVTDIRQLEVTEKEKALDEKRAEMSHQVIQTDEWPLFDVRITKIEDQKHRIHISFDNIIFDGWSMFHLLNEWAEVYRNGKAEMPITLSFRDYVLGLEQIKSTSAYEKDKKYWEDRVETFADAPDLLLAKNESQITEQRFCRRSAKLSQKEWLSVKDAAGRLEVTPSVLLMSAYAETLRLWSSNKDFTLSKEVLREMGKRIKKEITVPAVYTSTLGAVKYSNQRKGKILYTIKQINIDIEAPAYVIFTSGSTGNPKGVIISHSAATNTILDINNKFKINSDDRILNISNLSFDLSVYDIFGTFFAGAELVQVNEEQAKDPAHWYDLLKHENISVFNGVPGQMKMLTMFLKGKEKPILDAVRLILLSGDWIPVDLPKEISKYFPNAEIVSLGGATEAAIWSIYYPINIKQNYIRSIPYGKPLANQRFYILNEKGEETLDWISGDIYIAGKGLAIGYLGDPELTEKKFIYSRQLKERLYKTGDIGRYMPDGTIEFQGRSDFQVKIRGHRVELGEIEMAIVEILHPKDLKVITVNNNDVISICMFAVLENESDALSKEELGKYLSEKIPQYMIPVYCEYLSEIPLTVNGKIDIKVLTSRAIEGMKKSRSRGKSEQKLSETEENIYKVWCELFNTTDISVDEDFFECGGDSILVVKLLTELETRYQYKMSLMDVYSSPTIYKMAECITNQQ